MPASVWPVLNFLRVSSRKQSARIGKRYRRLSVPQLVCGTNTNYDPFSSLQFVGLAIRLLAMEGTCNPHNRPTGKLLLGTVLL